jgi:hypothetical protein
VKHLPATNSSIVVRTDFSDDAAWESIKGAITAPVGEFMAYVDFVDDPEYEDLSVEKLPSLIAPDGYRAFVFLVDRVSLSHPELPILVVDLVDEPGRTFRVIPSAMWSVENNLSLANLDFVDFADSVDDTGVFRGF